LLTELDETQAVLSRTAYYVLPELLRTTLGLGDTALAEHFAAGIEPRTPAAEHAFASARAQLAEAAGKHSEAAMLYADAAERWRQFGNVGECGYALLGHGRCLLVLGGPAAEVPLAEARDMFASMGYKSALTETEKLLAETVAKTA
jgi:hypothetical protein